ncbi:ribulokinase [candidate division KSB3 bacterium]|uniref:Ribulokinase n=1 Tax=candidate division KSB3 bacterium TaxID=2044937 RepID=A0A2G6KFP9_9BACT|nr:MAG: ribulokinase [candidate division KSB3 bacterium]
MAKYVIGLDYGSDSVRTVIVNIATGKEEASEVMYYPRWTEGKYCDPAHNQFRQHPLDYIETLEGTVKGALAKLPEEVAENVISIGIDTTGSTPCLVDEEGTPLALKEEFKDNPNGMFVLWKDHTAVKEAEEINRVARTWGGTDFTQFEGGVYSSEWFWAKILHVLRLDEAIREAAFSAVEHCDWMPAILTGDTNPLTLKRSRCAAGHKAMWHESWGGLPDEEFLITLDPLLKGFKEHLYTDTYTSDVKAGELTEEWAARLGLKPGVAVAVGAFDAHMGAVGAGITKATLSKIMGTSTCDMIVAPVEVVGTKLVAGICGQVDGSILPGMIGFEAGQSAFGDVYAWFKKLLSWPIESLLPETTLVDKETIEKLQKEMTDKILAKLAEEAAQFSVEDTGLVALDWLNGRRSPFADQTLKGAILGLTLGSSAAKIFRALVEATAFGARAINEQFMEYGVEIDKVIATGGIAKKSEFVMQITADVLNMPIEVVQSEQAVALGAGMFGAVAAGAYANAAEAQKHMMSGFSHKYVPNPDNAAKYQTLYEKYQRIGKMLEKELQDL